MRICCKLLFVIFLCCVWKECNTLEGQILRSCISAKTCENCLQAGPSCAWCSDSSYSNSTIGRPRCNSPEKLKQFGCLPQEIRTSSAGTIEFIKDLNFQDMEPERIPIQLRPQRIKVMIPPHSEITIPIRYRLAKNYPLDLYYLMDLTWTMKDDKETLIRLGWNMSQTFGSITNNFRLGFGSYADKPVMPYIFPGHEENPCKSEHAECSPIYSYWHHLKLTGDIQRFITEVNNSQVTGNVDNLEGALDGLVQAIVCTNEINWARQARKIILVATDGHLHTAGDGKLGGAVKRQDFKCHLNERGQYYLAAQFDYSSLAELSRLLQEYKINVIFAVTEERRSEYQEIVKLLREKATIATLTSDSSNILDIIENAYHQITSKLILRDNSSSPLIMEYFSNCGKGNVSKWNTLECDDIKEGQMYDFKVVLSYKECPRDKDLWKQRVVIEDELASQLSNIIIDVELLCGCNCKDTESSYCQHGTYECGLCKCDSGWSGETCDCDESSLSNNVQQCIRDNSTKICSERGDCVCGKCFCDDEYKGEFCECSACDKMDGIECSNKGTCNCGVCQCIEGWEGNACQCPSTNELCIAPGSQEICAGHGYCDCGECRCNVTAADGFYYRGTYCESTISTGGSGLCVLYDRCVNATVEDPKKANEFCQTNTSTYNIERVESVDIENGHYCVVKTVMGRTACSIRYVYEFQKNNVVTLKIGNKQCQTPVHAAVISSMIIIGIVCLGLAFLLIWKCWTSIKDRREYEKFKKEQQKTVFSLNQNPLFKSPISRYSVPSMYKED